MPLGHRREPTKHIVHQIVNVLGIEPVPDLGGPDNVDEQDRHLLERRAVVGAVTVAERGEAGPQRSERDLDDRIAKGLALRFQRRDRRLEFGTFRRHEAPLLRELPPVAVRRRRGPFSVRIAELS